MASRNQNDAFVLPFARLIMAEEMKGPMKPDVLPTVLKRAKNMYALGAGTTSDIMLVAYAPQAAVWNCTISGLFL